jgi:predicted ArsR family transcriptional regulator
VEPLATELGLHPNTVRGHLGILERAGLIERIAEQRRVPGRPRALYRAVEQEEVSPAAADYSFLSEVLASVIQATSPNAAELAELAGREWGRHLADRPAPFTTTKPADAVQRVIGTLNDLGFEPRGVTDGTTTVIRLLDCPFREVALRHGLVVCSIHKGLVAGMLDVMATTVQIDALEPFVQPSLCIARLSDRPGG